MKKNKYLFLFLISFIMMLLVQVPEILSYGGYFIYTGDYNYQNIVFSAHCYELVRSGRIFYDFTNTMGTDVISSFAHIIVTPFFIISLLLPSKEMLVLALPVMTALKTATASVMAGLYIGRYVKKDIPLYIGSLLYAFSGFQSFSLVFGSFHDITPWFPLMLYFLDEYFENNKKFCFLLTVFLSAASNAFFFYGQVIFVIIYFIIKAVTKQYKVTLKNFAGLALESVTGVLLSGILLYPGVLTLSGNSRVSEFIYGMDMISYSDRSIVSRIVQSIFMMPDVCGSTTLFTGENTWSSLSLYLPVTGVVFVISYIMKNRRSWDSLLVVTSMIIAVIPVLNSLFFMFNSRFYARWFYMPVLIMALVTAKEIEIFDSANFRFGICVSGVFFLIFAFIGILPGEVFDAENNFDEKGRIVFMGFPENKLLFWRTLGLAALFVLVIYMLLNKYKDEKIFFKKLFLVVVSGIVVLNAVYIHDVDMSDKYYSRNLTGSLLKKPKILSSTDDFFRIDGQATNANLYWDIPGVDDFITIASPYLNDFYDQFGIFRVQKSFADYRYYPLWSLFSCRYYFSESTGDDLNVEYVPFKGQGFETADVQPYYHIYENKNYIPAGFQYDKFITVSELDRYTERYEAEHPEKDTVKDDSEDEINILNRMVQNMAKPEDFNFEEKYLQKMLVLMNAVVVDDDDAGRLSEYMQELTADDISEQNYDTFVSACDARRSMSCYEFNTEARGFNAGIKSENSGLVFFSIPYDEGWSAEVNGEDTDVVLADYGFMAVNVPAGDNVIKFSYRNRNYSIGAYISLAGLIVCVIYISVSCIAAGRRKNGRKKEK